MRGLPLILYFLVLICSFYRSYSVEWAVEFDGNDIENEGYAEHFGRYFSLKNHGIVAPWNVYIFTTQEHTKKSQVLRDINFEMREIQEQSPDGPTHPLEVESKKMGTILKTTNDYVYHETKKEKSIGPNRFRIKWIKKQEPQIRVTRQVLDPMYKNQWHINPKNKRSNVNVTHAWNLNYHGEGVNIAICDNGLRHTHGDFVSNYNENGSWNFDYNIKDPTPNSSGKGASHGTNCAGAAAASDDGSVCGVGVAYRAGVSGISILQSGYSSDYKESSAMLYMYDINHIYSNSWGPPDDFGNYYNSGVMFRHAIDYGTIMGRNRLGSIYVWASGNGAQKLDSCSFDEYASNRKVISVGSVDSYGKHASFSEGCTSLLVVTPSAGSDGDSGSIITSDSAGDTVCENYFSGTSASCAIASGSIALIIQAAPNLTWLDVQHVLVSTSSKTDPSHDSWKTNGAGYHYSEIYGFGLINVGSAVEFAKSYTGRMIKEVNLNYKINSDNLEIKAFDSQISFHVSHDIKMHHVQLSISFHGSDTANYLLSVYSPSGTLSVFQSPRGVSSRNYLKWTFTTKAIWGETSRGMWKIRINPSEDVATLESAVLSIYGTSNSAIYRRSVTDFSVDNYTFNNLATTSSAGIQYRASTLIFFIVVLGLFFN